MFDERSVTAALADVGYRRLKRNIYRADWSTDVEHFLYFQLYGTPRDYLTADFGVRTKDAEIFAHRAIQAYGPDIHRLVPSYFDERTDCSMIFSFSLLASWGTRSSLRISSMPGPALAAKVKDDVEQKLFPLIRQVTTCDRLLTLLDTDTEPYSWVYTNGAMRAAMMARVAWHQLGLRAEQIRALLLPHEKEIGLNIDGAPDPNPQSYIERIIADCAATVRPDSARLSQTTQRRPTG
jgi:hypothetical protein